MKINKRDEEVKVVRLPKPNWSQGWQIWHQNLAIFAPNGINLKLLRPVSVTVLAQILKSPIWGQSDPIWMPHLTSLGLTVRNLMDTTRAQTPRK